MEQLFWKVFNASDENELHNVVQSDTLLSDDRNWYPYGGSSQYDRGNFGTFEIQQSNPIPALREKLTNSLDTMLLKECRIRGVDPKSPQAPDSMEEAVEKFFGIKNGDFSEVSQGKRRDIAENIQLIATGDLKRPNLLVYDNGEGQHPDDFPSTFLSLGMNNKVGIRFVQGKYNFGSTGAVVFCGNHRYQVIASKLHEQLAGGRPNTLGFTVIRRHPLTEQEEDQHLVTWYEYFLIDGKIPRFHVSSLNVGLWNDRPFVSGSLVRLYSYQLPRGSRTDITLELWRDLNQYLYQPALPILLYEKRFTRKSPSKLMLGNKTRVIIDERDKKEVTVPLHLSSSDVGSVQIEATVFKQGIKEREFIRDSPIIFSLNGQVQGYLGRRHISRDLALPMLRDSLLVHIDCTQVRARIRQDLFMANRQNLKEGDTFEDFWDRISEVIKSNDQLRVLNTQRTNSILHESAGDIDLLKELLSSIPIDDDLMRILKRAGDLSFASRSTPIPNSRKKREKSPLPYASKRFPSIFKIRLNEDAEGKRVKSIPLEGKGIVEFETNVEDEYFFRPKDRGEFQIQVLGIQGNDTSGGTDIGRPRRVEDVFDVTVTGPTNQSIRVVFEPKAKLSVGDEININARLTSPSGDLESIFYVRIANPQQERIRPKNHQKQPPALPTPIRVYREKAAEADRTWTDFQWDGHDIVRIIPAVGKEDLVMRLL